MNKPEPALCIVNLKTLYIYRYLGRNHTDTGKFEHIGDIDPATVEKFRTDPKGYDDAPV